MQLLTKPGDRHWGNFHLGCGHPGMVRCKEKTKSSLFIKESVKVPRMGPGDSYTGLFGRSIQQDSYWSKDPEYRPGVVFKWDRQVTSCYVITEHVTPVGCLVTLFMSRFRQLPFASANDITGTACYNRITGERN